MSPSQLRDSLYLNYTYMSEEKTKMTIGDKFWGILIVLAGFVLGFVSLWMGIKDTQIWLNLDEYQTIQAPIEDIHVYGKSHTTTVRGTAQESVSWLVAVDTRYSFDDRDYHKEYLEIHRGYYTEEEAQQRADLYSIGDTFELWIHPDIPDEPLLPIDRPSAAGIITYFVMAIVFIYFTSSMLIGYFKDKREEQ